MRYVYLVRAGKSEYKVGITSNILKRVKQLQTSNANLIEVVAAKQTPEANILENKIHKQLVDKKGNGGREWFNLTADEALDIAVVINQSSGISISEVELLQEMIEEQNLRQQNITAKMQNLVDQVRFETPQQKIKTIPKKIEKPKIEKPTIEQDIERALIVCKERGLVSTSFIQRKLSIGYGRASRIVDAMELAGIVGEPNGAKARHLLI